VATYRTSPSQGDMEDWFPLEGFWYSRIWAQMMRQISRRGEDIGVTCNWRNVLNPGSAVQYPEDDFLVGHAGNKHDLAKAYMEQFFSTLNTICEESLGEDCKLWFYAPNEGSLVYCTNLDAAKPMTFTGPSVPSDLRGWKSLMVNLRTVVDALDRQKTMFPIPHPAALYTLQYGSVSYVHTGDFGESSGTAVYDSGTGGPYTSGSTWGRPGYYLDTSVAADCPTSGGGASGIEDGKVGVICDYRVRILNEGGGASSEFFGGPDTDTSPALNLWRARAEAQKTQELHFDADDWAEYLETYGLPDDVEVPVEVILLNSFEGAPFDEANADGAAATVTLSVDEVSDSGAGYAPGGGGPVATKTVKFIGGSVTVVLGIEWAAAAPLKAWKTVASGGLLRGEWAGEDSWLYDSGWDEDVQRAGRRMIFTPNLTFGTPVPLDACDLELL
jgi:hypothetical protein